MAGTGIEIRASQSGGHRVERALGKLLAGVKDREPLMDEIGAILVASTQDRFERGRGPDGEAWKPSIRALLENGQTLVKSGILLGSITHRADNDSVAVGSNLAYAGIHQHGGQAGRNRATTLPARPYLGIDRDDERDIEDAADDYVRSLVQ